MIGDHHQDALIGELGAQLLHRPVEALVDLEDRIAELPSSGRIILRMLLI